MGAVLLGLFYSQRRDMEEAMIAFCVVLFWFWVLMVLAGAAAGVLIAFDEIRERFGGKE